MHRYLTIAMALGCLHCTAEEMQEAFETPETEVDCTKNDDVELPKTVIKLERLEASASGSALLVFGTAAPPRGLAIRALSVAGVDAVSDSFNYRTWNATVPESAFTVKNEIIELEAIGSDACNAFKVSLEGAAPEELLAEPPDQTPSGGAGSE